MTDQLIGATELAAALGVAPSTIHRRVDRGDLTPAGYVGNRPVFRAEDVAALQRGEQTLTAEPRR